MAIVIDGTFIVNGEYAVHVEFNPDLSELEYFCIVEELKNTGSVVMPYSDRFKTDGDREVERIYKATLEDRDRAIEDMLDYPPRTSEWLEAQKELRESQKLIGEYTRVSGQDQQMVIDNDLYEKHWGAIPDRDSALVLLEHYRAFAANECVHVAIIPLKGEGLENWESRITDLDFEYLDSVGGMLIPVPEICLLDREVIKILNENGYHVKDNAKFMEVAQ